MSVKENNFEDFERYFTVTDCRQLKKWFKQVL